MGVSGWASIITDPYERAARLYPALLALFPLLAVVEANAVLGKAVTTQLGTLLGTCGVAYLLANISRMLGKARELDLFRAWGGTPTTQLLRHRDERIEPLTKQRYHLFLGRKIKAEFPSHMSEAAAPEQADDVYQAGVKWLLGKTRDKKRFALLFKENVSYGFHRNGLGLRWLGFLCSLAALVWQIVANHAYSEKAWLSLSAGPIVTMSIATAMCIVWLAYFTEMRAKQAAFAYAEMLLRACDDLR